MIKVKEHIEEKDLQNKLLALEELLLQTKKELQKTTEQNKELESILAKTSSVKKSNVITIKSATKIDFVNIQDILFCKADESYTYVQLINEKSIIAAKPLSTFEKLLDEHPFFRISKSYIINIDQVVTFHKDNNQIELIGNIVLDVARRRRIEFLKRI